MDTNNKPMTVDELIAALSALSPEDRAKEVRTEGCDCYGRVGYVEASNSTVDLQRPT